VDLFRRNESDTKERFNFFSGSDAKDRAADTVGALVPSSQGQGQYRSKAPFKMADEKFHTKPDAVDFSDRNEASLQKKEEKTIYPYICQLL